MTVTFKQLLETSYVQISSRLEELQRVIALTRSFSLKTNSHLKIMTSLVNDLTDSDDTLQLVDTELNVMGHANRRNLSTSRDQFPGRQAAGDSLYKTQTINVNVHDKSGNPEVFTYHNEEKRGESVRDPRTNTSLFEPRHSAPFVNPRFSEQANPTENFKAENDKLWEYLKKGEKDVDFIKQSFEKLLENFLKTQSEQRRPGSVPFTPTGAEHQHPGVQSVYLPNGPPKSNRSRRGKFGFSEHESGDSGDELDPMLLQSVQGFKKKLGALNKELTVLKRENPERESMMRDLQEKSESQRRELEQRTEESRDLLRELKSCKRKVADLEEELKLQKREKEERNDLIRELETNQQEVISRLKRIQQSQSSPDVEERLKRTINQLRKDNDKLALELQDLKTQKSMSSKQAPSAASVDQLKEQLRRAEDQNNEQRKFYEDREKDLLKRTVNSESTTHSSTIDDFIKCVLVQADFIEKHLDNDEED